MLSQQVLDEFGLQGAIKELSGGTQPVYRVENVVLKRIVKTSFENQHSLALAPWLGQELDSVSERGFRLSSPLQALNGKWMSDDGWMAWSYVEGKTATIQDIPVIIQSIRDLNTSLRGIVKHPLLDGDKSAWGYAHYHCFRDKPIDVHPILRKLVAKLYGRCKPLPELRSQLIHGDLNLNNIIISPSKPCGFIDFTPFWAPADFALAMFANWAGPRTGNLSVLKHFKDIEFFDQLLIRASIRMLLVVSHLQGVDDWENTSEKTAAELVLSYVQ